MTNRASGLNGFDTAGNEPPESSQSDATLIPRDKVKDLWRCREDYAYALQLQDGEFVDHYSHNKSERQLIRGDILKTKEEQALEDKYAAEYHEQLRLDREREDERLARKLQDQLNMEISPKETRRDEQLAWGVQKAEEGFRQAGKDVLAQDAELAERLQREEFERHAIRGDHSERRERNQKSKNPPRRPPLTYVEREQGSSSQGSDLILFEDIPEACKSPGRRVRPEEIGGVQVFPPGGRPF